MQSNLDGRETTRLRASMNEVTTPRDSDVTQSRVSSHSAGSTWADISAETCCSAEAKFGEASPITTSFSTRPNTWRRSSHCATSTLLPGGRTYVSISRVHTLERKGDICWQMWVIRDSSSRG